MAIEPNQVAAHGIAVESTCNFLLVRRRGNSDELLSPPWKSSGGQKVWWTEALRRSA
jgi:hypothetical protein